MSRQFLSFVLDGALYAVEVAQVQEVLEYTQPVRLPCTIDYVEGLISSREQGISVVNLRKKFELKTVEPTKKTRIIIIEIAHTENDVTSVWSHSRQCGRSNRLGRRYYRTGSKVW